MADLLNLIAPELEAEVRQIAADTGVEVALLRAIARSIRAGLRANAPQPARLQPPPGAGRRAHVLETGWRVGTVLAETTGAEISFLVEGAVHVHASMLPAYVNAPLVFTDTGVRTSISSIASQSGRTTITLNDQYVPVRGESFDVFARQPTVGLKGEVHASVPQVYVDPLTVPAGDVQYIPSSQDFACLNLDVYGTLAVAGQMEAGDITVHSGGILAIRPGGEINLGVF